MNAFVPQYRAVFLVFWIFVIAFILAACGSATPAPLPPPTAAITPTPILPTSPAQTSSPTTPPGTPIALGVGYIPSVQFAPLYVAMKKGYFAEEGLDVTLEYGFETDYVKLLGLNERAFIIASGDVVILGRAQGLPITYVAEWYTKYPVVVFSLAEKGIRIPQDLVDKTVGIPSLFGTSYVGWKALVQATKLPEDNITLKTIGFTQAAAVQDGLVDAAVDYAANGPVQLQVQDIPTNIIVIDDYMHLPSNGLVTNEQTLAEHPEWVQGMVRGLLRGIADTLNQPDEAFEISLQYVPEAAQNPKINRAIFDASLPYWTPNSPDMFGRTAPAIWPETAAFLQNVGLVNTVVETKNIWTNDFVENAGVDLRR